MTIRKKLPNKPLVEAVVEIHWNLPESKGADLQADPHYRLLLGRLQERIQNDYPTYQPLPAASVPDEMVGHVVQHQFRKSPNGWPLIQLGPGIVTLNETEDYDWIDFQSRGERMCQVLFDAYPRVSDLAITRLALRYINAIPFDYVSNSVQEFLREKMRTSISLPPELTQNGTTDSKPWSLRLDLAYRTQRPLGRIVLNVMTARKKTEPVIRWESRVASETEEIPPMPAGFSGWLNDSHEVTDKFFFTLIEGELYRRFSGE